MAKKIEGQDIIREVIAADRNADYPNSVQLTLRLQQGEIRKIIVSKRNLAVLIEKLGAFAE